MTPATAFLALLTGCGCRAVGGCDGPDDSGHTATDFALAGPYAVGRHTSTATDAAHGRTLTIETWYPASESADPSPIADMVVDEADRAAYDALLAAAPAGCPATSTSAGVDAAVADAEDGAGWPVVAMSHCHDCTRFSTVTVAERLASRGFVVVAPDHAGNTLFDALAGDDLPLDTDTLAIRVGDLEFALDQALGGPGSTSLLVPALTVDPTRVGVYGHSFGSVTAGMVLQDRLGAAGGPTAGMFVGAPPENPLLAGVSMENLDAPLLFELLDEDHSIGEAGNVLIQGNYDAAPGPAWLYGVVDAGHWSPSDLVGLTEDFMPGCGDDTRESSGEAFTYADPAEMRALSASMASAFFAATLDADPDGTAWLDAEAADSRVEAQQHE